MPRIHSPKLISGESEGGAEVASAVWTSFPDLLLSWILPGFSGGLLWLQSVAGTVGC